MNLRSVRGESKSQEASFPRADCKLCGCNFIISFEYHRMGLCENCAQRAGAAFVKAHTGESHPFLDPEGYAKQQEWRKRQRELRPPKKNISANLRLKVLKRDGYRCKCCGSQEDLEADHVKAESRGGPTTFENLQTLCRTCNQRKGARDA